MLNVFSSLKEYGGSWSVKDSRKFTAEEVAMVVKAEVVPSRETPGNSVVFTMINGKNTFIPLSRDSTARVGDSVDVTQARLLTLSRPGDNDILRVEI